MDLAEESFKNLVNQVYNPASFSKQTGNFSFPKKNCFFYSLARFAMFDGLKVLNLMRGDTVLLPSFICRDFLAPFNMMGLNIKFYDVNENLEMLDKPLPSARAIVCVNYFGFGQDISSYKKYCDAHGAFLLEDNAHGFLSRDKFGEALGTRGDLGVFSLRKTIPIYNGAVLMMRESFIENHNLSQRPFQKVPFKSVYQLKRSMTSLTPFIHGHRVQLLTLLLRKLKKVIKGYEIPPENELSETKIPGDSCPHFPEDFLSFFDQKNEIRRRRELYKTLENALCNFDINPIFNSLEEFTAPYSFPFVCEDDVFQEVNIFLKKVGLEAFSWPLLPKNVKENCPNFYRKVRLVRFLW